MLAMTEPAPKAELLRSLGRLVRGLSATFWGLPLGLVIGVQTARTDWLRPFGVLAPMLAPALLLYGLWQLGHFQQQERIWSHAVERAKLVAFVNLGLSPFLFWWYKMPYVTLYSAAVSGLALSSLIFLCSLNQVLKRLAAMLPDETMRHETHVFTSLNLGLLAVTLLLLCGVFVILYLDPLPSLRYYVRGLADRGTLWFMILLVLLPLATTMALIWKIKEAVLTSLFNPND